MPTVANCKLKFAVPPLHTVDEDVIVFPDLGFLCIELLQLIALNNLQHLHILHCNMVHCHHHHNQYTHSSQSTGGIQRNGDVSV